MIGATRGVDLVAILGLTGGMPTRVSVERARLDELMTALRDANERLCECVKSRDDLATRMGGRRCTDHPGDGSD